MAIHKRGLSVPGSLLSHPDQHWQLQPPLHAHLESAAPDKPRQQPSGLLIARKHKGTIYFLSSTYPWQNAPQHQWLRQAPAWVWQGPQDLIVRFVVGTQCLGRFSLLRPPVEIFERLRIAPVAACKPPILTTSEFRNTILAFGRLGLSMPASLYSCETMQSTGL